MSRDEPLIFLSLAAYRDPQLTPTVLDCLRKASHPERLRFGICWQRDEEEHLPFFDDPRFRILTVDWRQSRGACWARAEVMKLWQGEDWFLQLDSHCRFASGWDERLLQIAATTGSPRPILTTYPAPFTPAENEVLTGAPLQVAFHAFTADGIPQLWPQHLPHRLLTRPAIRARFLAAGFLFAPGRFVQEVPYDPALYFMGEESAMTVRAFTHGYDLFHPTETLLWHDYGRHQARRHWADHTEEKATVSSWNRLDEASRQKVQQLLRGEPVADFGLGSVRTLKEYEQYAGLSFRERKAQQYTLRGEEPPNPYAADNWTDTIRPWIVKIGFCRAQLPEGALDDPKYWFIGIQDTDGADIYKCTLTPEEIQPLHRDGDDLAIVCEFSSEAIPASWLLWPLSRSEQWLPQLHGRFEHNDIALLTTEEAQEQP